MCMYIIYIHVCAHTHIYNATPLGVVYIHFGSMLSLSGPYCFISMFLTNAAFYTKQYCVMLYRLLCDVSFAIYVLPRKYVYMHTHVCYFLKYSLCFFNVIISLFFVNASLT